MLRNVKDLLGYAVRATDGVIGQVKDFYIDDQSWTIRYFVVETGNWLDSRKVLVPPIMIGSPDWRQRTLSVSITLEQVKSSPNIDTKKPVSRQHETDYLGYYALPLYWGAPGLLEAGARSSQLMPEFVSTPSVIQPQADDVQAAASAAPSKPSDVHLRSYDAVMGYHVHADEGEIGHVQSLLVDEQTWAVRFLIVSTSNWWLGHEVLIAPEWIHDVSWPDRMVSLDLTRQKVKDAPPYDAAVHVDRMQEASVYKRYGRTAYWVKEQVPDAPRAANPR